MKYYVYVGVLDSVIMYIGKGTKQRMLHLNSGTSNCYEANKLHFSGGKLDIYEYAYFYKEGDALSFEKEFILEECPAWNIVFNTSFTRPKMKKYPRPSSKGKKPVNYTSEYLGVGYYKTTAKWRASYNRDNTKIHIGFYQTELEAAMARDKFLIENNIDLPLNFIDGKEIT